MSVFAKDRKETKLQYVVTAQQLQIAIMSYLMNEKHTAKKWRLVVVEDTISIGFDLLDNIGKANLIYPNNEEKLKARKDLLRQALENCIQLENRFSCMIRVIKSVHADNLKQISSLLFDEIALLKGAYQNAKIVGK